MEPPNEIAGSGIEGHLVTSEQILWTRLELPYLYAFQLSGLTITNRESKELLLTLRSPDLAHTFEVSIPEGESENYPSVDDIFSVICEVSKGGDHLTPYFRCPTSGAWTTWNYANKLALKLEWFSAADKCYYSRYVQSDGEQRWYKEDEQCSQEGFCQGAAIYAYFMRSSYPSAPPWFPNYGLAKQAAVTKDGPHQRVSPKLISGPVVDIGDMRKDERIAALMMHRIGLANVNGPFQSLNNDWMETSSVLEGNQAAQDDASQRTECDACYLRSKLTGEPETEEFTCSLAGTNRCWPCVREGRPCSWTNTLKLCGDTFFELNVPGKPENGYKLTGELFARAVKCLRVFPARPDNCAKRVIAAPSFDSVSIEQVEGPSGPTTDSS